MTMFPLEGDSWLVDCLASSPEERSQDFGSEGLKFVIEDSFQHII